MTLKVISEGMFAMLINVVPEEFRMLYVVSWG